VLVAGGLFAGFATRSDGVAKAEDPLAAEPQASPGDPDDAEKRLEKRMADLQKQKELLDAMLADLAGEKAKLENEKKAKADAAAAEQLGKDIAVEIGAGDSAYTVREVVNGKVAVVTCFDLDILRTYLTRAFNDPKGPKQLRVAAHKDHPADDLQKVFAACALAGYTKAAFSHTERRYSVRVVPYTTVYKTRMAVVEVEPTVKPGEIDLTKYAPKK